MKVVTEKPVIVRICDEIERTLKATGKLPLEILLSPQETLELKATIWHLLPRRWILDPGLPPEFRLWGVPVKVDEAVIG